jgi:PKD repeat protein
MKKLFTLFVILTSSFSSRAQISAEFTWCPVYDTTTQLCCIQFENLSVDSGGPITSYFWSTGDGGSSTYSDPQWCYSVTATYIVYLIVTGPSGVDTIFHPLTINHLDTTGCNCDSLIGVNEIASGYYSFSLAPNPFHERTVLKLHSNFNENKKFKDAELRIYNSLGELMRVEKVAVHDQQEIVIERATLSPGVYHFEINTRDMGQVAFGKFLIE